MPRTIPLIRAANVLPLVRYMEVNRLPSFDYMKAADLTFWYALDPLAPVPLLSGIKLLRNLARDHGPDVGARIINQGTIPELAFIGGVALGSRTPTEALQRASFALPFHSTHEWMQTELQSENLVVEQRFNIQLDAESLHAVQVMFFSLVQQLCRFTTMRPPFFTRIEAVPHPVSGLKHIKALFDAEIVASNSQSGRLWIRGDVAANPFRAVARGRTRTTDFSKIDPLAEGSSLAGSIRPVIDAMLHDSTPTIARLARSGGMTVRTMQRALTLEGTSFSEQLDIVRRRLALEVLSEKDVSLSNITDRLGYSSPPALVRAIRRLTGVTPMQLKRFKI